MSSPDITATDDDGAGPEPGVAGLAAFRGRTTRFGAPVLPPGWRPDGPPDALVRSRSVIPLRRPVVAPEAKVLPAPAAGTEVRVVRKVRPWSVWKLTLAFAICIVAVLATAGAVLWAVAASLGVLGNVEGFVEDMGFDNFAFDGGAMLRALVLGGLIVSVAASVMASILVVMFNLLSDLTGGIEAELAPKAPRNRIGRKRAARLKAKKAAARAPAAPEMQTGDHEVVHMQLALDDLVSDTAPSNGADRPA